MITIKLHYVTNSAAQVHDLFHGECRPRLQTIAVLSPTDDTVRLAALRRLSFARC